MGVGGALHPRQGGVEGVFDLAHELSVRGPAVILGRQQQEQGSGVHAAVVAAEDDLAGVGGFAHAGLVDYLARLFLPGLVGDLSLKASEAAQDVPCYVWAEGEGHDGRERGVAPEQRIEPGDAGGDVAEIRSALRPEDAQVGDRAVEGGVEEVVAG